jgi:hypothetical protein
MKTTIKLEEALLLLFSLFCFQQLHASWIWFWVLFLAPDIGMIGYVINTKVGAVSYNLFLHKGIALAVYFTGFYFTIVNIQFAGILLFAHSSFDRMLGYGLKYSDNFKHTHLGMIGEKNN